MRLIAGLFWALCVILGTGVTCAYLAAALRELVVDSHDTGFLAGIAGLALALTWLIYRRWAPVFLPSRK